MRKILVMMTALLFAAPAGAKMLYFAAKPITNSAKKVTYSIGKHKISATKVMVREKNFQGTGKDIVVYESRDSKLLEDGEAAAEFIGSGYLDAIARVAFGISPWTAAQVARLFHAMWKDTNGEWTSGTAKQWIKAGKPRPVFFSRGVLVQGKEGEMN